MTPDTTPRTKIALLRPSQVKKFCHARGHRVSGEFLTVMDMFIARKLEAACGVHNGGKITLDATVAGHVGIH